MATDNPRVAAYPPPHVYERLVEFKRSRGFKSDSAAIVAILETYLFSSTTSVLPSEPLSTQKRIEDLEEKVSSLRWDVAVLKQAMSQYTGLSSGELPVDNSGLHQSDNCEHLSEPLNTSPNTSLEVTNESVSTYVSTSISELQIIGADGDTQSVKSSVCETTSASSELLNESLLVTPTAESILNYPLIQENTPTNSEPRSEVLSEPLDAGSLMTVSSQLLDDSLDGSPRVEENNQLKVLSLSSEPPNPQLSNSLEKSESKNSLEVPSRLTGAALARRLNVSPSTLRHKKNARNFGQWTSLHDPDGIAWHFDGEKFIATTSPGIQ